MAVAKFSMSLPEELVMSLDEIAAEDGLTRSAVIREVAAAYVTKRASVAHEAQRRRRVGRAIKGFERIAEEWGADERTAADLLHEVREEALGE